METLTAGQAARIIGCPAEEVAALLGGEPATLAQVEGLAVERYRWRLHVDDRDSYWVTAKQAPDILGVSIQRVKQYLAADKMPYVRHSTGVPLMRRDQLETAANARAARARR